MGKMTKAQFEELISTPVEARREVPDRSVRGLYLVLQPGQGRWSWAMRYRHGGKPRKYTLEGGALGQQQARALAEQVRALIAQKQDPAGEKIAAKLAAELAAAEEKARLEAEAAGRALRDPDSVAAQVEAFLNRHVRNDPEKNGGRWIPVNQNERTGRETQRLFRKFVLPAWGERSIHEIRRRDVHDLLDGIKDRAPTSANRVLSQLKVLWNDLLDREVVEMSPVAGFRPKHQEAARDRVLTDDELVKIWRAAEQMSWPFREIVRLLALTACRRDEIAGLRWSEIDLDNKGLLLSLPGSRRKGEIPHTVPLSEGARDIIDNLPRFAGADWLFPARPRTGGRGGGHFSGYSKAKARLDQLSGVTGWRIHDIRRTVATRMQKHFRIEIVEEVLGHVSGSRAGVIGTYQLHKILDEKREALVWWERHLRGLLDPTSTPDNVVPLREAANA